MLNSKFCYSIIFFLIYSVGFSQNYTLTGVIVDPNMNPLISATVYAETVKDSKLLNYSITGYSGDFQLDVETSSEKVNLFISYNGFKTKSQEVLLNSQIISLGSLELSPSEESLGEVIIKAKAAPVIFKGDTLQFNADSFKTRSDANLEDLLKKLPGVEVDRDGTITVNGEKVNQILINGTAFFEEDLRIATKNLPKSIIDKVQVMSNKSEVEEFTGKESSSSKKNINITLKKDKDKGINARAILGYGTNDRYQINSIINYFNGKQRLSFLGGSNNINNPGFSFDEVYDMVGNSNSLNRGNNDQFLLDNINFGSGDGITVSNNIGLNYSNIFKNNSELTADYFYGGSENNNTTELYRENLLPQSRYILENVSDFQGDTDSHRMNVFYQRDIDSTFRFSIQPKVLLTKSHSSRAQTQNLYDINGTEINESNIRDRAFVDRENFSNSINFIKNLNSKGGYVSLRMDLNRTVNKLKDIYDSEIVDAETNKNQIINQKRLTTFVEQEFGVESEFRKGLFKNIYLDLELSFKYNDEDNDNKVYDLIVDSTSVNFSRELSSDFNFEWNELRPKLGFTYETTKLGFNIQSVYNNIKTNKTDAIQNFNKEENFNFFTFQGFFRYQLNQFSKIFIDYKTNNHFPSTYQLQNVEDLRNPINIIVGNPLLKPERSHDFRLNFTRFDFKKKLNIIIFSQVNILDHPIVNSRILDESFISRITFVNAENLSTEISGGIGIIKQFTNNNYTFKLNTGSGFLFRNNVSFINNIKVGSDIFRIIPRIGVEFKYRDLFELEPKYKITFNHANYNIEPKDLNFVVHNLSFRATTFYPNWLTWGNDINYLYNGNIEGGLDKFSMIWNMSLGANIMKGKGNIKLTAYDLLDQNANVQRITTSNYIENIQNTVLERYFMLSFSYNFNTLEK